MITQHGYLEQPTSNRGNLGVIAFYYNVNNAESHLHPYLTLAFGQYNTTNNKWEMMPIVNSSASLPVKSKDGNDDYNIGDFLTIKDHKGRDQKYQWDMSGYVIVGGNYFDTNWYFLMVR